MKRDYLLLALLLVGNITFAQSPIERGLNTINRSSAEATINFLAGDELQGREAGFHGSRVTSEYIVSLLQWMGVSPLADSYFQPFDAYRKERQKKGRLEVHPDSIAKLKQAVHQKLSMRNVLGMIPGKNTKEYVIVGAHFDHLGIDPALDGDQIYNGADDNASGVSAVLQIARAFLASGQQPERNVVFAFWDGEEKEFEEKAQTVGVLRTPNEDIRSLKELVHYGLKGMAAYVEHAHNLGYRSPEIFAFMQHALAQLTRNDITMEELVQLTLETGKHGISAMAQLDKANTGSYGNPEISEVNLGVRNHPGILISGHDLKDLEELLEQTEGTGIDIYTHSEMLPAHYYPQLKKYKHLAGYPRSTGFYQKFRKI